MDRLVTKMSSVSATNHQSRQELLTWINSLELDYSVSHRRRVSSANDVL